jgi:hypothetical protein
MGKDDLVVNVTVRHDFIGDARDVLHHGTTSRPSAMSLTRRSTANAAVSTSTSIAAPLAWRALRLLRSVVPPTSRAVMLLCLVPCNYVLL